MEFRKDIKKRFGLLDKRNIRLVIEKVRSIDIFAPLKDSNFELYDHLRWLRGRRTYTGGLISRVDAMLIALSYLEKGSIVSFDRAINRISYVYSIGHDMRVRRELPLEFTMP